jgi:hypothetical protein
MRKFSKNFLILCDEAFLGEHGKVNIIGIFERIYSPTLPAIHLKSVLVANFEVNDPNLLEADVSVDLMDEHNKTIGLSIPKIKIKIPKSKSAKRRAGIMVQLGNLKFENYGSYKFIVKIDSEVLGECIFEVQKP